MKVTLELPDEWADCLPSKEAELAEIVVAGLRRRKIRARHELNYLLVPKFATKLPAIFSTVNRFATAAQTMAGTCITPSAGTARTMVGRWSR